MTEEKKNTVEGDKATEVGKMTRKTTRKTASTKKATTTSNQKKELSLNDKLLNVIEEIRLTEDGKIEINDKKYTTVAKRNEVFRKIFAFDAKVITEILHMEGDEVVVKATISVLRENNAWDEVATGHAQENRSQSQMNMVSALENAETSAIGRALSNLGISGGEYSSSEEFVNKKNNASTEGKVQKKMINKFQKEKIENEFKKNNDLKIHYFKEYEVKKIEDLTFSEANDIIKEISSKALSESEDSNDENDEITVL